MLLEDERKDVVKYCKMMIESELTKGTGGNISIYNREKDLVAISPSGIEYSTMTADDVVVVDLKGDIVDGRYKPSSELNMHLIFYNNRDDINALVHTHSVYAKTLSSLRITLPAVSYLIAYAGHDVRCAKYASFGTKELAENAYKGMLDRNAVLLANHGMLAGSKNIKNAFNIAEEIEFCAEVYYRAKTIGTPIILDEKEMSLMIEKFKTYGNKG